MSKSKRIVFRFLIGLCAVVIALYAGGVLLNWLVDPYGVYGSKLIKGFNAGKPQLHKQIRRVKAVRIADQKPAQMILGTSRSEYGLDFDHPCWEGRPFNASMPAGNLYEAMRYMQHAAALGDLKRVVVSLDFFAFNAHVRNKLGDIDGKLAAGPDGQRRPMGRLKYSDLFSPDAIATAWSTVWDQKKPPRYHPDLRVNEASVEQRAREGQGHRWAFHESAADYMFVVYRPPPTREYSFRSEQGQGSYDTFDCFRRILELGHRENADLRLFITPSHVWQLEIIKWVGLWDTFEEWKRLLVETNASVAKAAGKAPFPLWDFFYPNTVTVEPVPVAGDTQTRMKYFLEGSHFTKETGRMVLDRIFPDAANGTREVDDFGVLLTVATIDDHLARTRAALEQWRQDNPADAAELAALWEKARSAAERSEVSILQVAQ